MGTRNRINAGTKRLSEKTPGWFGPINPEHIQRPGDVLVLVYGSESAGLKTLGLTEAYLVKKHGFATYENKGPSHTSEFNSLVSVWKSRIAALKAAPS